MGIFKPSRDSERREWGTAMGAVFTDLSFRRMSPADLPLVHEWHQREHVRRWWTEKETYEKVAGYHLPAIEGQEPTQSYLIMLGTRPVGFIQTYLISDYPEWEKLIHVGPGVAGVDLFIGERELTGTGLGTEVLRRFAGEIVFAAPSTTACVADQDVENQASIRAFEKAGFRRLGEFLDPDDDRMHFLVRLDRENAVTLSASA